MKNKLSAFLFAITSLLISACGNGGKTKEQPTDTPTSGEVKIAVDESYALLFETQVYTFESLYKRAKIHTIYKPETEALQYLINDSCKVIVINRDLKKEEKEVFEKNNIYPKSIKIAEDAIALIVNKENTDSTLTIDQLQVILMGKDSLWKNLNADSKLGKIKVVFDNPGSANARYLKDSLMNGKEFPSNIFAVKSNPEVIEYVSQHPNSLGIISVNWISDSDDTLSISFLKKVRVVGLNKSTDPNDGLKYYKPYQAYIKSKEYPLTRDVYMINRQTRAGLGMGFVSFVAGEKGQRMILKSGLVPASMPTRVVQFK